MAITRDELRSGVEYKVVVFDDNSCDEMPLGSVIELFRDDGSISPWFKHVDKTIDNDRHPVSLDNIEIHKNEDGTMKSFTKADLKDWMVVERRNGSLRIVCLPLGKLLDGDNDSYFDLSDLCDDLLNISGHDDFDVMAVYSPKHNCGRGLSSNKGDLIWKREEKSATQLKIEEIEKRQRELADQLRELRESV